MPSVKFSKVTINRRHSVFGRSHLASKGNVHSFAGQLSKLLNFAGLTLAFCHLTIVEKKKTGDFYAAKIVSELRREGRHFFHCRV